MARLPIDDYLDVVDHHTVFKSGGWWKCVVLVLRDGQPEVAVYLWQKRDGEWKRKQKMKVDEGNWEEIQSAVSEFLENKEELANAAQAQPA